MTSQTWGPNPIGLKETLGAQPAPASHEVISVSHGWDMFLFSPSMGTISELLQDGSARPWGEMDGIPRIWMIYDDLRWFDVVDFISIQHMQRKDGRP